MQHARLGLIVGKKAVARASARNRIKRVIRERFRIAQSELPAVDMVVRVVGPVDRARLHKYLDRLFTEVRGLSEPRPAAEEHETVGNENRQKPRSARTDADG